jgi:hypothetical protein
MLLKIVGICVVASFAFAAEGANFDIEKAKSKATKTLENEIKILNDAKSCVASAKTKAELQACREKAKIDLKAAKADSHTK